VRALRGDDVICVTAPMRVVAGPGDDLVDTRGNDGPTATVDLGEGDDTFVGGAGEDTVYAGGDPFAADGPPAPDIGVDTIATGPGEDRVSSGSDDTVNPDRLDLGEGDDGVRLEGRPASDFALALGTGGNRVELDITASTALSWLVGHRDGLQREPGETVLGWTGSVGSFYFHGFQTPGTTLRFVGTDSAETVLAYPFGPELGLSVDLGRGDDTVFDLSIHRNPGSTFTGGAGRDSLVLNRYDDYGDGWPFDRVYVDLTRRRLDYDQPADTPDVTVTGFERVQASGPFVSLKGDSRDNELTSYGCQTTVIGGDGADLLTAPGDRFLCGPGEASIRGGGGGDHLVGGPGNDVLLGGPGRDRADGRLGQDTCRAEVTRHCERT